MKTRYETRLVKNCLIPMSDGTVLAADLYRPVVDHEIPTLVSMYPYHKDDNQGPGFFEGALRSLAQAGYACLLADVRGTGNSGGSTSELFSDRELRDYYEVVEWAAVQPWSDGNVGAWGMSYGSINSLLLAEQRPAHLRALAAFHGAGDPWDYWLLFGGRLALLQVVANWAAWMVGQNFMPPGYRDSDGRWLSVWQEHLEANEPYLVSVLDRAMSDRVPLRGSCVELRCIDTPTYLWAGWHDLFVKPMIEAYGMLRGPKKLTIGPWAHAMPDSGHAGRIDYVHELQRWFDYWLRGHDTGIMDEPPVAVWVQGADEWVWKQDFPPKDVTEEVLHFGPEGVLSGTESIRKGNDSFRHDATLGTRGRLWDLMGTPGLPRDQRPDELKGVTYTSEPLDQDVEISGVPEALIRYTSTVREPLLVVKLCDVAPDGKSTLITSGWVDLSWVRSHRTGWGDLSEDGSGIRLNLIPTCYRVRRGHRVRAFVAGSDFPRLLPSPGRGESTVKWGDGQASWVKVPIRASRGAPRSPAFRAATDLAQGPVRPPIWRIEENPSTGIVNVRLGCSVSLTVDGGGEPARVAFDHRCWVTASELGERQPSAHAESVACWESSTEAVKVRTVMAFRPVGLDLSVHITVNDAPYWQRRWVRKWPLTPQDESLPTR